MAGVIDLATYAYHLELDDKNFTLGMRKADSKTEEFKGKLGGLTSFLKTAVVGTLASVGVAAVGMAVKGVKSADELKKSLNGLQTSTGAADKEMKGLEKSLINIYNNNFGESFDDIANSMSQVKQTTGLTGEELEKTTQTALMIRDTFQFDVNESINTVNSLMKQFGISADEAYTIIAQGAQNGANKNGDLLDTLNEYAPHFKALGYSADQFNDILIQGAKDGSFSIDKIGDAVKEFTIRSKDMSTSSAEAFNALGFNADEMFSNFAEGSEKAQKAAKEVLSALGKMDDPLKKNQIGVALFGTMFEDLEADAIISLGNIQSVTDSTADTLDKINEVKYDTFGEALDGIKRNLQTGIVLPIGQPVLPILNQFANWLQQFMPQIQKLISVTFDSVGKVFDYFSKNTMPVTLDVFSYLKDTLLPPLIDIFNYISNEIVPKLAASFNKWIPQIKEILSGLWELVKIILDRLKQQFDIVLPFLKTTFTYVFDTIINVINVFLGVLKGLIDFIVGVLTGDWERAWEGIAEIFSSVFDGMRQQIQNQIKFIQNIIGNLIDTIGKVLDKINIFNKKKVDNKTIVIDSDFDSIPSYDIGTPFVPNDQLALIHKGESIIPASFNPFNSNNKAPLGTTNNINVNVSLDGANFSNRNDIDYLTEQLQFKFNQSLREVGVRG